MGEVPEARRGYQWAPFDPQQQQRLPLLPPALLLLRIYGTSSYSLPAREANFCSLQAYSCGPAVRAVRPT